MNACMIRSVPHTSQPKTTRRLPKSVGRPPVLGRDSILPQGTNPQADDDGRTEHRDPADAGLLSSLRRALVIANLGHLLLAGRREVLASARPSRPRGGALEASAEGPIEPGPRLAAYTQAQPSHA